MPPKKVYLFSDPKHLEASIKIKIDHNNLEKSTMTFDMNAKGSIYRYNSANSYDDDWTPGSYNLSAAMNVVSIVHPNPRYELIEK